jgi:hypothetical protein
MPTRRYVVKMVTAGSPAWSGTVWGYGCKHLKSAEALFRRKSVEVEKGDALFLIDRHRRVVLRSLGSTNPKKTADAFGAW